MIQVVVIGLSRFAASMIEALLARGAELLIIDKDRDVLDGYRNAPVDAVWLDVLNEERLRRFIPKSIDAVVIDLGKNVEASILATKFCEKIGIGTIIAKAETEEHAEILRLVGATKIVFPNREAAKRIVPQLVSSDLLAYVPLSDGFVIAEIEIPPNLMGLSLKDADLRSSYGLNVLFVKSGEQEAFEDVAGDYRFRQGDVALVSGSDRAVAKFSSLKKSRSPRRRPGMAKGLWEKFPFGKK